jgi:sugar diacid utilization regulator
LEGKHDYAEAIIYPAEFESIHLVAGQQGTNRPVGGVNVMESANLAEFFKKNELLITTGINIQNDTKQLLALIESANQRGVAGIILNVGPYIPRIPEQVICFADQHHFPVYEMPWAYRVADFVKKAVQFLDFAGRKQARSQEIFSEILFNELSSEQVDHELFKLGIKSHAYYAVIVCAVRPAISVSSWVTFSLEEELLKHYHIRLSLIHQNQLIFMVERKAEKPTRAFFKSVQQKLLHHHSESKLEFLLGVGNEYAVYRLSKSYREALDVIRLIRRQPRLPFFQYENTGIYKVLLEMPDKDKDVYQNFSRDTLAPLYRYDQSNRTKLVSFLRIFLEEDGHTSAIARREFLHRNTVLYKMKKIQSILDADLANPYVKVNLLLAFMINDVNN